MKVDFRKHPARLFLASAFGALAFGVVVLFAFQLSAQTDSSVGTVVLDVFAFGVAAYMAWYHIQRLKKYEALLTTYLGSRGWTVTSSEFDVKNDPPHLYPHGGVMSYETFQPALFATNERQQLCMFRTVQYNQGKTRGSFQLVAMQTMLSGSLAGWVRLQPHHSAVFQFVKDIDLESTEFNKAGKLSASDDKLAYAMFPPDVMQWYLNQTQKPWIHVEGNVLTLVLEGMPQAPALDLLTQQLAQMTHFVETEGALNR